MAKKQRELLICRYCGVEFLAHRLNPVETNRGEILGLGEFCGALCFQHNRRQEKWYMVVLVGKHQFIAGHGGIIELMPL